MTHTPTPWHIELDLHGYSIWGGRTTREIDRVANLCGDKDFDPIANANAAFIVEACNNYAALKKSHAELLEMARIILPVLKLAAYPSEKESTLMKRVMKAISAAESLEGE